MNILYHHRTQGQGAEGNHIREVVKALKALGHQVDMISPPGVDPFKEVELNGGTGKASTKKSVLKNIVEAAPQALFEGLEIGYNLYSSSKVRACLRKATPDLIYERYAFFCRAPSRIANATKIPHILEVNEISGIKRQRPQTMVGLCRKYENEIFHNTSAVIVVSDFLKNEIVIRGIDPGKIFVIPNAIDPQNFNPDVDVSGLRKALSLEGKTAVTFVGMFSFWDKLDVMVDSFAKVKKSCPDTHFIIVGEGVQRPGLMEQAKALGLEADITFTGKVSRADVPRYIALSDLCVLYGSNPFGSPMALFEYMSMGKPVVAPGYGPVTTIVDHGVQGLVFTPDDQNQFTDHIIELVRNREKRRVMGAAARARIEGQFTWANNAKKIIQIYEKVKHDHHC